MIKTIEIDTEKGFNPKDIFTFLEDNWKYLSKCENGLWVCYEEKPILKKHFWCPVEKPGDSNGNYRVLPIKINYEGKWEDSLFQRLKKEVNEHCIGKECEFSHHPLEK